MTRVNLAQDRSAKGSNGLIWDVKLGEWTQPVRRVILTGREIEVLIGICQGLTLRQIAKNVHRSFKTIEAHKTNLRQKLGIKSDAQLGVYALASGFIDAMGNDLTKIRQATNSEDA